MELTISHSSFRVATIISLRCKASSHQNRLMPMFKSTPKDIKSANFLLKCSANQLILPVGLYEESRFSKSFLLGQNKRNSFCRACSQVESSGSDPVFAKVLRFGSTCYKFARPYAMRQAIISTICLFARVFVENKQLFKWSLLFKAFPGLIAIILAHAYYNGINQIFDVDIDRINKPYLPIPSGELSLKQAWFLMIFSVLTGLSIFQLMKADRITTSLYCFGLLLATLYSAPPFRFKGSSIATAIVIPLISITNCIGILYATRVSLGLPFWWSPPIVFITTFAVMFFVVICIIKDIPDVEGDMKNNIRTFAAIFGARNITILGTGILVINYIATIGAAIYMPQVFKRSLMLPVHSTLALLLLFQARKLDKTNYTKVVICCLYSRTQQSMSVIDNWGDMHHRGDTWVNLQAEQTFVTGIVNEEDIMEQFLGTSRGHKTGVGPILPQNIYRGDASSSGSRSARSSTTRSDPHVEEYLQQSYQQNLQLYESIRIMQDFITHMHPNMTFPAVTRLVSYVCPSHPPPNPSDDNDDDSVMLLI
ncbi:homogentisate solanesyltransferase, chloroplastic [Morus notabilis]|uniref:homogentisate solanesyltransferase, chloroplastic n=1 Tax=Morus notabilis TaxID=981085 RepID=UPI000CECF7A8|nr:homogentisate solanesyltransferase, chloroplastic [Morus notabilis]